MLLFNFCIGTKQRNCNKISIHLMLLFNTGKIPIIGDGVKFQYI